LSAQTADDALIREYGHYMLPHPCPAVRA